MEGEKTPYLNTGTDVNRHTLLMILGCLIPLVILGILWFAGVSQNILSFGIILLCPIMHLVMMKNMKHDAQTGSGNKIKNKSEEFT